jgi:hypothetical protein
MRIIARCAMTAVTVSAALATASAPAHAATGTLILSNPGSTTVIVRDPPAGCRSTTVGFSQVTNNTNVYVTVYTGIGCGGVGLVVSPGSTVPVGDRHSFLVPS